MKYITKLQEFKGANGNEKSLEAQFKNLAEYFLKSGHFVVNGTREVHICDVEFYYHEEKGAVKDWIMYHRNNHPNSKTKELGYLELGQLNSHPSGIDITFENEEKGYRASMLIRGFKIVEKTDTPLFDYSFDGEYDKRSTHVYDALLNCGNVAEGISIIWKEQVNNCEISEPKVRVNVPEFKEQDVKIDITPEGNETKKYKQCGRLWRYHIK